MSTWMDVRVVNVSLSFKTTKSGGKIIHFEIKIPEFGAGSYSTLNWGRRALVGTNNDEEVYSRIHFIPRDLSPPIGFFYFFFVFLI